MREYLVNRQRQGMTPLGLSTVPAGSDIVRTAASQKRALKKAKKRRLVRRSHVYTIIAAWLVTVPCSAAVAALIFYIIRGAMLP